MEVITNILSKFDFSYRLEVHLSEYSSGIDNGSDFMEYWVLPSTTEYFWVLLSTSVGKGRQTSI